MNNKVFLIFILVLIGIGLAIGHWLAMRVSMSVPSVLNVIGILYSITAVIVLYEAFAEDSRFRALTVKFLAPIVLWAHTVIPLGMALSWVITRGTPHGDAVATFGFSLFSYSILPLTFLDSKVVFPRVQSLKSIDGRYKRFGFFLLLSGQIFQLVSAVISV